MQRYFRWSTRIPFYCPSLYKPYSIESLTIRYYSVQSTLEYTTTTTFLCKLHPSKLEEGCRFLVNPEIKRCNQKGRNYVFVSHLQFKSHCHGNQDAAAEFPANIRQFLYHRSEFGNILVWPNRLEMEMQHIIYFLFLYSALITQRHSKSFI